MKAKKVVAVFMTAAMTMGMLAGCGSNNSTGTANEVAIAQRAKVMPVSAQMQQEQRVPEALIHQIWQEHRSPC